jgi:alginate O-acetyltransferase complex protein AlgJ
MFSHTSPVSPSSSRLPGYLFAGLLGMGLISSGWLFCSGKLELPPNLSPAAVLHGAATRRIASQLSSAWLPEQAADLERAASWLWLHDTGPRVRPGCADWLFLNDELLPEKDAQANADAKARAVIDVQNELHQRGIRLLVVIVPDKSRIAARQLCGLARPAALAPRVQDWNRFLYRAGVATLDLTTVLQSLGAAAYLHTDTHWNELGARSAATAIAQQVLALDIRATPSAIFDVDTQPEAMRAGDLVHLAGIDWLPLNWQPQPDIVAATQFSERQQAGEDDLDDLLGDADLPNIALIGTSFSRNSNFVGFLQLALGARIGSFAKDGGAFSGSANAYFSNPAFMQTPPKLVIWEIPERDLQTPYEPIHLINGRRS